MKQISMATVKIRDRRALKTEDMIRLLIISAVILSSVSIHPFYKGEFTVCPFKNIFGIPCPFCGMTRSFLFLGHGEIREACRLNPLGPLVFMIVVFFWFYYAAMMTARKEITVRLSENEKRLTIVVSAVLVMAAWGYNLLFNSLARG